MADALNRRDIDMIFRAETDSATRSVGELRKSVGQLRGELAKQVQQAERGELSLEELAATTRDLKRAQDELGTARSLLTQLNTLTGRFEKAEKRAGQLTTELAALKAEEAATVNPTKQLTNAIARKEKALSGATEKMAREKSVLDDYRTEVEGIVGPVDRLEDAFRDIAKTSKDVAQGLAIAGNAQDTFAEKTKAAAAAQRDLDDFQKVGRDAGLLQQDIDYLAQFEDRIERVTAARNEQIAADLRFQEALESTRLEQERLAQTEAFRKIAADARASVNDVGRFKAETVDTEQSMRRLATAVADLADPARAASRDLSKVSETVDQVASRVENASGKRRTGDLSNDLNDLEQALAGLQRQAAQIDGLRDQRAATDAAQQAWTEAKLEVLRLADAIDSAGAGATDDMVRAMRQAEAAAEGAGNAYRRESTTLKQLEAAAEAATIDIYNLDRAETQIIATSTRAGAAAQQLRRQLGGGTGSGAFLGLRPYELQNLGFQINDIFVSLASGQNPLTVLAQQGSQIAQLFPGVWGALAKGLPILGPLAVALGAVALGTSRLADNAQRAREISAALVEVGTASQATAGQVEEAIQNLDDIGASADDAKKSILSLVKEGMDPAFFDDFSTAAQNFAEITGEELPETTERLLEGLTQGKDAVLALDDEFRFLSDAERDQIRAMDDSTDAAEIRTIAFDAFYNKAQDVADELRGPSYEAVITLESAWDDFLDTLADVAGFEGVDDWLANLTNGLAVFVRFLSNAIKQLRDSFGKLAQVYSDNGGGVRGVLAALAATNDIAAGEKSVSELFDQSITELATERAERQQGRTRTSRGDPGRGTRGARGNREGQKSKRSRSRGKSDAERLAEQLLREQEQLQRALEQMTSKALTFQQQSIEQQLANTAESIELEYAKLYRQLDEFGTKFGADATIGGLSQAEYRAQLDANKQIIIQREQLKVYEENINDLLSERSTRLAQIEERQNAGLISADQALQNALEVTSELNPAIEKAAQDARAFAIALGGANPSPELREFIAKLDGVGITLSETKIDVQKAALANLNEIEQDRNDIIQRRDSLIAANAELVALGLMTEADAREQAAAAFEREAVALRELIAEERTYIALLLQQGIITQTEYQTRMAQLDALAAQTEYVDSRILQVNAAAQDAFVQGFTTMFNTFAQGLANLITGGESIGDMLENLGMAALQFAADFLKAIADVLVQMIALQAAKAIFGASTGGIGGIFFHGGGDTAYGGSQMTRSNFSISPLAVAAAPRYHNGTPGAGLRRNEMVAVLERGEKVVTEEQQRLEAKRNARGAGGGNKLRQVLAFGDEEIAGAMAGPAGEEVTVTHIRRNASRIRQELGID